MSENDSASIEAKRGVENAADDEGWVTSYGNHGRTLPQRQKEEAKKTEKSVVSNESVELTGSPTAMQGWFSGTIIGTYDQSDRSTN